MAAPKLERKSSSRWNLFKKRRKKKQQEKSEREETLKLSTCSTSPPRSDATSATSAGGTSLLGRIVTKKRSKRNIIQDNDGDEYVPPEIGLNPSLDVLFKDDAPAPNDKPVVASDAVVPPAISPPPSSPVVSVSPEVNQVKVESVKTPEPKAVPEETSTPPKVDEMGASKSEDNEKAAPNPVVETISPNAFLSSLREVAASPTSFLSDLDPFGFPSSPKPQGGNDKDTENTWSSFLQPFPSSGEPPTKPAQTSSSSLSDKGQSVGITMSASKTKRKPVAEMMENASAGKQHSPALSGRKPVADIMEKSTEGKQQSSKSTNRNEVVMENSSEGNQYSPIATEQKSAANMKENDSPEMQQSPVLSGRKPVANVMEKSATEGKQQSPSRMERKSAAAIEENTSGNGTQQPPLLSEGKPVADVMKKATVEQPQIQTRLSKEPVKKKKMDPPGSKPVSKSEPSDPFGEDSVFSSLTWDTFEEGGDPALNKVKHKDEQIISKETESTDTPKDVTTKDATLKAEDARANSDLVEPSNTPKTAAPPSRKLADKSNELSLSQRSLLIKRMAKAKMERNGEADESESLDSAKDQRIDSAAALKSNEAKGLSKASTRSSSPMSADGKTAESEMLSKNPEVAIVSTPNKASSDKLKKRAIDAAVAHTNAMRRDASSVNPVPVHLSSKADSGRARGVKKANDSKALNSVSKVPGPLNLVRRASSFEIENRGPKVGRQRSNSFDLPRSQVVGSKVQEHATSSRGTELYLKRHRRHVVDKYESVEQDLEDDIVEHHSDALCVPSAFTKLVTVEDCQEGEIEMVIPGEPGDALCKFEAYHSEGDLNESTVSCTDFTSDDLYGDGSDGSTCSFATDDESKSLVTNESGTYYTYDTRSRFTDSSTLSKGESKRTVATDDSRSYESRSYVTSDHTYESRSYLADDSFMSRGSTAVTNDYISDEGSTCDEYDSEEDEPVDSYFWEDIAERLFAPGLGK